jgi:hypothetical protein
VATGAKLDRQGPNRKTVVIDGQPQIRWDC